MLRGWLLLLLVVICVNNIISFVVPDYPYLITYSYLPMMATHTHTHTHKSQSKKMPLS